LVIILVAAEKLDYSSLISLFDDSTVINEAAMEPSGISSGGCKRNKEGEEKLCSDLFSWF